MSEREEKHAADMRAVAHYIHRNPGANQETIARETELTVNQVKHCLDDLKRSEYVRHEYSVDPKYLGYELRYRVDIFVAPSKLRKGTGGLPGDEGVGSQKQLANYILRKLPDKQPFKGKILVEDVQILLGHPADLCATVRASDTHAMLEFVTEGLRMCSAVYQTASCLEAWSCKGKD